MEKRLQRMTSIQLQMLVDILSVNPELISGKLTPNFTRVDRRNKWHALATLLNSKGLGPQKDADKWRKSWTDLKFAIRSKAAKIELAGGAELICEKLSVLEKRVLQMIGDVATTENSVRLEGESDSLTDKFPDGIHIDHGQVYKLSSLSSETKKNALELVLPNTVTGDSEVFGGRFGLNDNENDVYENNIDGSDNDENDNDDEEVDGDGGNDNDDDEEGEEETASADDDDVNDEESTVKDLYECLSTPSKKRRKLSSEDTFNIEPALTLIHKQIERQTAVLKAQSKILREIADSLHFLQEVLRK